MSSWTQPIVLNQAKLNQALKRALAAYHLIGIQASMHIKGQGPVLNLTVGLADKQHQQLLKPQHMMQIGSITKSYIAATLLMLEADAEAGRLGVHFNIEQPLVLWFPELRDWQAVKVKQLLNMTSGIVNYTDDMVLFQAMMRHPYHVFHSNELISLAYQHHPNQHFSAGTGFEYSNTNYVLAGMLIEKITHKPLALVLKEKIFNRFKHSVYVYKNISRLNMPLFTRAYNQYPHTPFYHQDVSRYNLSWANAAGAMLANSEDVLKWYEQLFTGAVLQKKQFKEMTTLVCPQVKNCVQSAYGLGIGRMYSKRYGSIWTHSGKTLGFESLALYIPKYHLTVVVLTNQIKPAIRGNDITTLIAARLLHTLSLH